MPLIKVLLILTLHWFKGLKSVEEGIFLTKNWTVVTVQRDGTANLPCVIRKIAANGIVSWVRLRDHQILTVGHRTLIPDDRFQMEHVRHLQNWPLVIKRVLIEDAGPYLCQFSSHPPVKLILQLKVTEAWAEIQGSATDLYLRAGSVLRLLCRIHNATEPSTYIFWYQDRRMINYDVGVAVLSGPTSSALLLNVSHEGNYTCSPSNVAQSVSVYVHFLDERADEEKSAAMQHSSDCPALRPFPLMIFSIISILSVLY